MWVLILVIMTSHGRVATTAVTMNSREACVIARAAVDKTYYGGSQSRCINTTTGEMITGKEDK